jgi:hypothetical protein
VKEKAQDWLMASALIAMVAMQGAMAFGSSLLSPARTLLQEQTGSPFGTVVDVREAFHTAAVSKPATDRDRIITLLHNNITSPGCRIVTEAAAENGIAIIKVNKNGLTETAAYYNEKTIVVNFMKMAEGLGRIKQRPGMTEEEMFSDAGNVDLPSEWLCHELTHAFQDTVWNNLSPPVGLNSYSRALWYIAAEAQADIVRFERNRDLYNPAREKEDNAYLRAAYLDTLYKNGHVDLRDPYMVSGARCDDGRFFTPQEFRDAFGRFPGREENFWEDRLDSYSGPEVYALFYNNRMIREAAERSSCPVQHIFELGIS